MMARHKYRAQPQEIDGIRFASGREARRYAELRTLEQAGIISGLQVHPEFPIVIDGRDVRALPDARGRQGRPIKYVADFAYFSGGQRIVEDIKGGRATDTAASRLKRALVQHIHHVSVEIVT